MKKGLKRSSTTWSPEQEGNAEAKERQVALQIASFANPVLDGLRLTLSVILGNVSLAWLSSKDRNKSDCIIFKYKRS